MSGSWRNDDGPFKNEITPGKGCAVLGLAGASTAAASAAAAAVAGCSGASPVKAAVVAATGVGSGWATCLGLLAGAYCCFWGTQKIANSCNNTNTNGYESIEPPQPQGMGW